VSWLTSTGRLGWCATFHLPAANSAAARNAGLAAARGRFLLLTDADCVAEPDWAEQLTTVLARGEAVVVGGTIGRYCPRTWVQRHGLSIVAGQTRLSFLPALHLPYVAGANAGLDTAQLRAVGGFDETLHSGNDVDVCYQLGLRGHQVRLVPGAVIWHEDRATVGAHFHRFRHYAVYQVLLFAKYKHISGKRLVLRLPSPPQRDRATSDACDRPVHRRRDRSQRPLPAHLPASRLRAARLHRIPAPVRST
jgi:GT2 family glycosyltransferase